MLTYPVAYSFNLYDLIRESRKQTKKANVLPQSSSRSKKSGPTFPVSNLSPTQACFSEREKGQYVPSHLNPTAASFVHFQTPRICIGKDIQCSNHNLHIRGGVGPRGRKGRRDIVTEFDNYMGDVSRLANWHRLCHDVGIKEGTDLSSITKYRKVLSTVYVNIWDLIDAVERGERPHRFSSAKALANYTRDNRRFYPLAKAKAEGPLRVLLKPIF